MSNLSNMTRFVTLKLRLHFSQILVRMKLRLHFFRYCATKELEIWPKFLLFQILHKIILDDERIRKNIPLGCLECQTYPIRKDS